MMCLLNVYQQDPGTDTNEFKSILYNSEYTAFRDVRLCEDSNSEF